MALDYTPPPTLLPNTVDVETVCSFIKSPCYVLSTAVSTPAFVGNLIPSRCAEESHLVFLLYSVVGLH